MAIINLSHRGDTSFDKLLGHLPSVQEKWNALEDILKNEGQLSVDLKEKIRKILAQNSGCLYCKSKGKPIKKFTDEKSLVCIGFVDVYVSQKGQVPQSTIQVLTKTLTDLEIVELLAFVSFTHCQQEFGAMMNLQPSNN